MTPLMTTLNGKIFGIILDDLMRAVALRYFL
jgi:hypothetical protein